MHLIPTDCEKWQERTELERFMGKPFSEHEKRPFSWFCKPPLKYLSDQTSSAQYVWGDADVWTDLTDDLQVKLVEPWTENQIEPADVWFLNVEAVRYFQFQMMSSVLDRKGLQISSKVDHMQPRMWTVIQQPTAQKTTASITHQYNQTSDMNLEVEAGSSTSFKSCRHDGLWKRRRDLKVPHHQCADAAHQNATWQHRWTRWPRFCTWGESWETSIECTYVADLEQLLCEKIFAVHTC